MDTIQGATTTHLLAVEKVMVYLQSRDDTFAVSRADEDDFHGKGADLVWYWQGPNDMKPLSCLVVGDRFNNGLFQLTTTEDADAHEFSPFLESSAVYLFYYFLTSGEVYIAPLPKLRDWFMMNIDSFEARRMAVKHPESGEYTIKLMRTVPIDRAVAEGGAKLIATA